MVLIGRSVYYNMIQKLISLMLVILSLLLAMLGRNSADPVQPEDPSVPVTQTDQTPSPFDVSIRNISKHGNVILDTSFDALAKQDIEVGDMITVFVGEASYDLPVGTSYTDVDSGSMICRFDQEDREVALGINMGAFATVAGIAEKLAIEETPGYRWDINHPVIQLVLKEKYGYLDIYKARNLQRTDNRADYSALTDEAFANFRAVSVSGVKANLLYRSSSPLDPAIGRNTYAMTAMEQAGIRSVINLTDSTTAMQSYQTYSGSYYSGCAAINPEMGYDFESNAFAQKIKDCVLFILENDGPFLIHCKEGKDRTGILCAILECFAGASATEIAQDYMLTYSNFYGVEPDSPAYSIILNDNLVKTLCVLFGIDSLENADLKQCATQYLRAAGLTDTQLDVLADILVDA